MTTTTKIGIIGGGQLGKMLIDQNQDRISKDNVEFYIYSDEKPLTTNYHIWHKGNLNNKEGIIAFGMLCDIITIEIENINVDALDILKSQGKKVYPDPDIIRLVQNKHLQKSFFINNNFPTAPFISYNNPSEVDPTKIKYPCVNKLQVGGYDGRGVNILYYDNMLKNLFDKPSIIENFVPKTKEISIIIGRNHLGITHLFPTVEMTFTHDYMLDYLICPANISSKIDDQAKEIAIRLANQLNLVGIMAIEFFVTGFIGNENLLINEISPRAHNSGHHTIDIFPNANQYNIWYNCLTNNSFPINAITTNTTNEITTNTTNTTINTTTDTMNKMPITIMINILGKKTEKPIEASVRKTSFWSSKYLMHLYNKPMSFTNRKMGHLTYTTDLYWQKDSLNITDIVYNNMLYNNNMTSEEIKKHVIRMKHSVIIGMPLNPPSNRYYYPEVSVIMGSLSDLEVIKPCIEILQEFNISYLIKIVSAHRTPQGMLDFALGTSEDNPTRVIIAAAGGAAHLPGMIASATHLPVIGIPIKSHNSINGIDSLLSIVQMPAGVPVGTMAIDGARNAGLYAIRMLGISDEKLANLMKLYQLCMQEQVATMNEKLALL